LLLLRQHALIPADRSKYVKDAEVFYRDPKKASKDDQGEGILCKIKAVVGEGKARRYDVQDIDPEAVSSTYRASVQQLVLISASNDGVPDPPMRRAVLAMYPRTTTFYRAEVVSPRGSKRGWVRLRFEDEEDRNQEQEVERRYVLADWPGKQP
jgi:SAGA-associated factor 29